MSTKKVIGPYAALSAVSMAVSQVSAATDVTREDGCSYMLSWTGSDCVGVVTIEGSNAMDNTVAQWATLDLDPVAITGASGQILLNLWQLFFQKMRIRYTYTSGTTGALTAILVAKTVGA